MTDKRRNNDNRDTDHPTPTDEAKDQRDDQRDDITRRREQAQQAQLTNREREERWPIG